MKNYPLLLNEIRFAGIGFDMKKFEGVIMYLREIPKFGAIQVGGGYQDLIDGIIENYVKVNLSYAKNFESLFDSKIIYSEEEINKSVKLLGNEYGYNKIDFGFNIIPNMNTILVDLNNMGQIDFTNVKVLGLTAFYRASSKEMQETIKSSFYTLVYNYSTIEDWSERHPVLTQMASTISQI